VVGGAVVVGASVVVGGSVVVVVGSVVVVVGSVVVGAAAWTSSSPSDTALATPTPTHRTAPATASAMNFRLSDGGLAKANNTSGTGHKKSHMRTCAHIGHALNLAQAVDFGATGGGVESPNVITGTRPRL
jgi:hypothetical protein